MKSDLKFVLASVLSLLLSVPSLAVEPEATATAGKNRPNILLIVVDDMAYSDLGSFGGEIRSPNLDKLAIEGVRFADFHTAAACSPTRAMLMTGVDHHVVGLGGMSEFLTPKQRKNPGYEGRLNGRVETFAQHLQSAGYRTFMAGKWHLGSHSESLPKQQGFSRSFALMEGAANHFDQRGVTSGQPVADYREGERAVELPEDFYSTITFTDKIIEYLDTSDNDDSPFFAYLAYTAPHWPLQAPKKSIDRVRGRYDRGYDRLRRERLGRMADIGMLSKQFVDTPLPLYAESDYVPWEELSPEEKKHSTRKMEIYAAMLEDLDVQVGRVISYLKLQGELDNTVVFFMSDNGGEALDKGGRKAFRSWVDTFSKEYDDLGTADSFPFYGPGWGIAGTAPFRVFKGYSAEGGIRTPAFVWSKSQQRNREISDQLVTVLDIYPTFLEMAGIEVPPAEQPWQRGRSMLPYLQNQDESVHRDDEAIGWELFGNAAIRRGDWKLVLMQEPYGTGTWQLFNVKNDPSELYDLAGRYPDKFRELVKEWEAYVAANGVVVAS